MSKYRPNSKRAQATWAAWDAAHGLVGYALSLGGVVASTPRVGGASGPGRDGGPAPQDDYAQRARPRGGNGAGPGERGVYRVEPPPPAGDDDDDDGCLDLVRRAVDGRLLSEADGLAALGEARIARAKREEVFVAALRAWLDCAGPVPVHDVVHGLAFLLGVSPATTKRYLATYCSPFGLFALDGDWVRKRRERGRP